MSADLERDLGAWSRGELTRERLLASHGAPAAGTVALHERLGEMAAATSTPDAEAGWVALLQKIEAPAPVVPLRRHVRRRRTVSLLVAAAVVLGGSAFAAIWSRSDHGSVPSPPATGVASVPGGDPAVPAGGSIVPGSDDRRLVPPPSTKEPAEKTPGGAGPSPDAGGGTSQPRDTSGGVGSASRDDPRDRDHGTGNDGPHDDHGSGNDGPSGTLPRGSHGGGN